MSDGLNEFETSIEGDAGSIDCNIFGLSPAPLQCAILGIQIEFGGRSIERSVLVNYGGLRVVLIEHVYPNIIGNNKIVYIFIHPIIVVLHYHFIITSILVKYSHILLFGGFISMPYLLSYL